MEKLIDHELWVGYHHPVNLTIAVQWFVSDNDHTARQKADVFIGNTSQCKKGKIIDGAKTAEEALSLYTDLVKKGKI